MFGQKPFGTGTTFGSGTFGTTTTASTPFGQTGSVFGTSTFGTSAPSTSGLFGQTNTGTNLFGGSTSGFGQSATSTAPGFGFGASNTSTSIFGANTAQQQQPNASSSIFGSTGFGQTRPQGFGSFTAAPTTGTGLFGQAQPQQQTAGLFGQSSTAGAGLFGSSTAFVGTPTGTTIKFKPLTGTDTMMKNGVTNNINTSHQCITCMKEYENKSLEELRLEDYSANRKGAQPGMVGFGPTTQSSLFSTPASSSSVFSFGANQNKPLFGTTGTNTFSSTGTGLFGQNAQQQNNSLFGKPTGFGTTNFSSTASGFGTNTGQSLFGQPQQQKPLFGQTPSTGLFGTPATSQQSNVFGGSTGFGNTFGTTTQANAFGAKPFGTATTTAASTFNFGNTTTNAGTSLFGAKPAGAFSFGQNTGATGFGTNNAGFNFGGATTSSSIFAPKTTSAFGTSGTAFGGGLGTGFGSTGFSLGSNTGTSLFGGNTANKPGFSFGSNTTPSFSFGQPAAQAAPFSFNQSAQPVLSLDPNAANQLQQQIQAQTQQIMLLTSNPYGDNPLFKNSLKDSSNRDDILKPTSPAAQKSLLASQYKVSPMPANKIKLKPVVGSASNKQVSLFHGLEDEESLADTFVPRNNVKKLIIKPKEKPSNTSLDTTGVEPSSNKSLDINENNNRNESTMSSPNVANSPEVNSNEPNESPVPFYSNLASKPLPERFGKNAEKVVDNLDDTIATLNLRVPNRNLVSSFSDKEDSTPNVTPNGPGADDDKPPHPAGIVLTRPGYFTIPSIDDLANMVDEDGKCVVDGFTVARDGYGNVFFPGKIDVAGLKLDDIVHFRRKEIIIYPDDDDKPPVGSGLNRKAQVTLDCVWPNDKTTHEAIKDPERLKLMGYQERIERATAKIGGKFIDYRAETGSWVFDVPHFSKYALEDSDDEPDTTKPKKPEEVKPPPGKATKPQAVAGTPDRQKQVNGHIRSGLMETQEWEAQHTPVEQDDDDDEMVDITREPMPRMMDSSELESSQEGAVREAGIVSPSTQQLAEALGVSTEKVQGMKASFFMEEDDDSFVENRLPTKSRKIAYVESEQKSKGSLIRTKKTVPEGVLSPRMTTTDALVRRPLPRIATESPLHLRSIERPVHHHKTRSPSPDFLSRHHLLPSGPSPEEDFVTQHFPVKSLPYISLQESVLNSRQKLLADIGCFMGYRFRVGWGPKWTLTHAGSPLSTQPDKIFPESGKKTKIMDLLTESHRSVSSSSPAAVCIERIALSDYRSYEKFKSMEVHDILNVQLAHSLSPQDDGDENPIFVPKPGVESLHAHSDLVKQLLTDLDNGHPDYATVQQLHHILELCVALWGNIPGCNTAEENHKSYHHMQARREAFSDWLILVTMEVIEKEIANNQYQEASHLKTIFSHLTGYQINSAVTIAQEAGENRLALQLAQGGYNVLTRKLLQEQLTNWRKHKTDKYIKDERLLIYSLLAGMLVWYPNNDIINCCKDLDWKRALALHLWYHCAPTSSVADAVIAYDVSFKENKAQDPYSQPPFPPYIEKIKSSLSETDQMDLPYDTCYYLLKLYCDRSQRLDKLLSPVSSVPSHLDFRISWILHSILSSLGFAHLPPHCTEMLHCDFASQLESIGHWHWAAFVLLHIEDPLRRKSAVMELLTRNISDSQDITAVENEQFLYEKLSIPLTWIYEAKAIRAHSLENYEDKAVFLLKAGLWNKGHETIVSHLATDAIINERHDYLASLLKPIAIPEHSVQVENWYSGGQVYLDYLVVYNKINQLIEEKSGKTAYEIERFQPMLISLCNRICGVTCKTARDRLAQSEIAKKTSILLRTILQFQNLRDTDDSSIYMLAPQISRLPMPEDYALDELRVLLSTYLLAASK